MMEKITEDVKKQMIELNQWINEQENLPNDIDEFLTLRFLHSCYYDIDKAKTTAKLFFDLRDSASELLTNRDPRSAPIQKCLKIQSLVMYKISGNRNLWISKLDDPGLCNFDHILDSKLLFLYTDGWLLHDKILQDEDVVIMDMKDVSFKILWKINFGIMRKVARYQQDAMPLRLNEIHLINTPPAMDAIYRFMKRFVNEDMVNKIHFHKPGSTTLFDYLSKDDVPSDYGGTLSSVSETMVDTLDMLDKYRDYFLQDDFWRKEKKNIDTKLKESDFRTLSID